MFVCLKSFKLPLFSNKIHLAVKSKQHWVHWFCFDKNFVSVSIFVTVI